MDPVNALHFFDHLPTELNFYHRTTETIRRIYELLNRLFYVHTNRYLTTNIKAEYDTIGHDRRIKQIHITITIENPHAS